jgi:hypothetical protein
MILRARFVVGLALLAAACGTKTTEPATASVDEQYINRDLAPSLAQLEAATTPLGQIQPGDVTQGTALGRRLMTARAYLGGFLVGASKLSPPTAWKTSLDTLVAIATDMAAAVDDLQMAADANRAEMFTSAHAKLSAALKRYAEWKTSLTNGLVAAHITQAPLPPPPEPTTKPPIDNTPQPCGGPCPCTATSIEKKGDVITACILTRDYGVSGSYCAAGKALFDEKTGELTECVSAAMFTPFAIETPGTPKERVAVCGAGPITKANGNVTSCILDAELVVGPEGATSKLEKPARIFFSDAKKVTKAVMPDGKQTCFDDAEKATACK